MKKRKRVMNESPKIYATERIAKDLKRVYKSAIRCEIWVTEGQPTQYCILGTIKPDCGRDYENTLIVCAGEDNIPLLLSEFNKAAKQVWKRPTELTVDDFERIEKVHCPYYLELDWYSITRLVSGIIPPIGNDLLL
jgi:hypothetical protein